jgi:hypothetical protein
MLAFLLATAPIVAVIPEGSVTCTSRNPSEIVVCGLREKSQRYRLPKLPDKYDRDAIRAEIKVAGLPTRLHVDSVDLPGGQHSNRLMLTVSTSF